MNTMMPISHRLFAAAVADGVAVHKIRAVGNKPVIIEVKQAKESRPAGSHDRAARSVFWAQAARLSV